MEIRLIVTGADDFARDLNKLKDQYPNSTEQVLKKVSRMYKQEVMRATPIGKKKHYRRGTRLAESYRLSTIVREGGSIKVEFYSKSQIFHLIERGHDVYKGGQLIDQSGFFGKRKPIVKTGKRTRAFKMVENTNKVYGEVMAQEVDEQLRKLIRLVQ